MCSTLPRLVAIAVSLAAPLGCSRSAPPEAPAPVSTTAAPTADASEPMPSVPAAAVPTLAELRAITAERPAPEDLCRRLGPWVDALGRAASEGAPPPPLAPPPEGPVVAVLLTFGPLFVPVPDLAWTVGVTPAASPGQAPALRLTSAELVVEVAPSEAWRPVADVFADPPVPDADAGTPSPETATLFGGAPSRLAIARAAAEPLPRDCVASPEEALRQVVARVHMRQLEGSDVRRAAPDTLARGGVVSVAPAQGGGHVWRVDVPAEGMAWRVTYGPASPEAAEVAATLSARVGAFTPPPLRPQPVSRLLAEVARAYGGDSTAAARLLRGEYPELDATARAWLASMAPPEPPAAP